MTIIDSTISDSTVNEYSIGSSVYAGFTESGEASHNQVTVSGSNASIQGRVYGGYGGMAEGNNDSNPGSAFQNSVRIESGYTALGSATGNVITVKGGTVNAEMVGGYDDGTTTNNTVTLYDNARFTGSDIYGGKSGGSSSDVFTGNTFNVYGQIDAG